MDWNRRYEEGDTPWDKGAPHPALAHEVARGFLSGRVLVPGCGSGHDVRALAAQGLSVTGLDIAPLALEAALSRRPIGGETYELGDLFSLAPHLRGAFDGVFEHTCFCAIDPAQRSAYVDAVAEALKPGGRLLAVFYLDPGRDGDGPPFGCTPGEIDALFGGRFRLLSEHRDIPTFDEREGRESLRLFERTEASP